MARDIRWEKTNKTGGNAPVGITQNPGALTLLANQAGGATVATLSEIGGTGVSQVFSVTGNANLTVSGSNLRTVASPSFTAGVNQTYKLSITDTGGTYTDINSRTLTVPAGPTSVLATPATLFTNATLGTLAANLTDVGGTAPYTWAIAPGPNNFSGYLNITSPGSTSTLTLNSSGVGNLVAGTPLTGKVVVTDSGGVQLTSATISISVSSSATAPTGITTSPASITVRSDQAGSATLATLSELDGTGVSVVFSVIGNANLTVSGSSLRTVASPSFTAGVNQTYFLSVTDTGGTYTDSIARTLTVLAAPTGINQSPGTITCLANQAGNATIAALTELGGTGASVVFSVSGDTNIAISGSNIVTAASPTFTPGVNQTYTLGVTDTGGSFTDAVRTITVPAAPTSIASSPDSILDNASANAIAATLTPVGGTSPGTWVITTGLTGFNIGATGATSTLTLKTGTVGHLTPGQTDSVVQGTVTYTDAAGLSTSAIAVNITVQDHTASTLIANITAVNTSTTTDTLANANTISFGHPIKDGDLSTYPTFQMADGTNIPFSTGQSRAWNSTKNKFAVYLLQLPQAIAHNVSGTGQNILKMLSNGSAPTASSLSYADITANTDFKIVGTIFTSVDTDSGTWTCTLNDCISEANAAQNNATIEVYANGQAGIWYVIEGNFKQSGSVHGLLRGRWEVQVLPDSGGALSRFRVRGEVCQPFWDVDTPTKGIRSFSALTFQNGATVIRDLLAAWAPGGNPYTFHWLNTNLMNNDSGGDILYGAQSGGFACKLTSTGTLPAPFQTNTLYFVQKIGSATQFGINSNSAVTGTTNPINATNAGTGTHTLTIIPSVTAFSSIFTCGENTMFDCFDSTGAAIADTTVRFKMDTNYWISTKVLMPWQVPASSASNKASQSRYVPNGTGGKSAFSGTGNAPIQAVGQTGDIPDLGPLPLMSTYHLFAQAAVDELAIRVNGFANAAFAKDLRSQANGRIPACNNGTYSGMSGPYPTLRFGQAISFPGHNAPSGVVLQGYSEQSNDHMPNWSFYPYLFTGEAVFRDMVITDGASAVITNAALSGTPDVATRLGIMVNGNGAGPNLRIVTISGGTTYYGLTCVNNISTRATAWGIRNIFYPAGILADGLIEKTYFTDLVNDNLQFMVDYKNLMANVFTFADSIGILSTRATDTGETGFQSGYRTMVLTAAATLCENTNAKTILSHLAKFPKWINDNMQGVFLTTAFEWIYRTGEGQGSAMSAPITAVQFGPLAVTATNQAFSVKDHVIFDGVGGTTQLNGNIYKISAIAGNLITLTNLDGSTVNTSGWGTFTSGGLIGSAFITDITQFGGYTAVGCSWTSGNATFTQTDNGMAQHNWVAYKVSDGDCFLFPNENGISSVPPGGFNQSDPYYAINSNQGAKTFQLTSVSGDAGHIVTPTNTGSAAGPSIRPLSSPQNVGYNMGSAGTYQIVMGGMMAAHAAGATVDATLIANMQTLYSASLANGNFTPNSNSKYLFNQNY